MPSSVLIGLLGLLACSVALAIGFFVGRKFGAGTNQSVDETITSEYYRGLNYILNEKPDKALKSFIHLTEVQPETVEIHIALGTLYRRKGEIENAIRIHQNLMAWSDLSRKNRALAMYELGRDYQSAGVLDRAEELYTKVCETKHYQARAHRSLISIYVAERDWDKAIKTAKRWERISGQNMNQDLSNYYSELAQRALDKQNYPQAKSYALKAQSAHPSSVRAAMLLGCVMAEQNKHQDACTHYFEAIQLQPRRSLDVLPQLQISFNQLNAKQKKALSQKLIAFAERNPGLASPFLTQAQQDELGLSATKASIERSFDANPKVSLLKEWVSLHPVSVPSQRVQNGLTEIMDKRVNHQCEQCGFKSRRLIWQCPSCLKWDSIYPTID